MIQRNADPIKGKRKEDETGSCQVMRLVGLCESEMKWGLVERGEY